MTDERPYHHGDLKNALVAAGIALLEEGGMPALSLRAIAARVGVSHTASRNHFGSLRGLLTAIAAEGFRRHAAFMQEGLTDAAGQAERQHAAVEGYVRFALAHPHVFALMFSPLHCDMDDPALRAAAEASYAVLAGIARGLDWDKADAPGAQRRAEVMLWSFAHGYAMLRLSGLMGGDGPLGGAPDPLAVLPAFGYRVRW